jgi:hypothetical protein
MKDYRFTIRLTGEDMRKMRESMKRNRIRKRSQLVRVALDALEKHDRRKESGELVIKLPRNLMAFLRLKKNTGYGDYSHMISELVRNHFVAQLEEIQAIASRFESAQKSIVSIPDDDD